MNCLNQSQSIVDYPLIESSENIFLGGRDLVYLAGLSWDAIDSQSNQLLSHLAQTHRVFFIAEPVLEFISSWWLEIRRDECGVWVVVAHLPDWVSEALVTAMHHGLMDDLFEKYAINSPILWYCTLGTLSFTSHLKSAVIVYDCMNKLSVVQDISPTLQALEQQLFDRADLVFCQEQNLHQTKQHPNLHFFPNQKNQNWNEISALIEAAIVTKLQTSNCHKDGYLMDFRQV